MTMIRHVVIRGRVQGVGFRAFVEDEAAQRDIAGWVRNRRDGTVEALFEGTAEAVAGTIEACRRGPRGARVDGVDLRDGNAADLDRYAQSGTFSVLPTA